MPPGINAAQLYVGIGAVGGRETIAEIMRVSAAADKVDKTKSSVTVEADGAQAMSMLDEISAKAKVVDGQAPQVSVTGDGTGANSTLDEISQKAKVVDSLHPEIPVTVDAAAANKTLDGLSAKIKGLDTNKLGGALSMAQGVGGGGGFGGALQGGIGAAGMMGAAGGAAAGAGILAIGSIMKAGEMEKYQTQLEVFLGSADAAKKRLAELTEFAKDTPFELPQVVQASKTLQVFAGDVLSTGDGLRMIGDVASGTQADFQEVAMWFGRMYDAMKSGRPFGEATQRLQELGAISGQDREKIENLAKGVKDGTMTMDDAWKQTSESFSRFSGMMQKQSGTFEGKMSNLSDAIGQGLAKIGEKLLPFAKTFIDIAIPAVGIFVDSIGFLVDVLGFVLTPFAKMVDAGNQLIAWLNNMGILQWVNDQIAALGRGIDAVAGFIGGLTGAAKPADAAAVKMEDSFDRAAGSLDRLGSEGKQAETDLKRAAGAAHTGSGSFKKLDDSAGDVRDTFKDMRSAIRGAADALNEQKRGHEETQLKIKGTTLDLKETRGELNKLEDIKHPTLAQQIDMNNLKLKVLEDQDELVTLKADLAAAGTVNMAVTKTWLDKVRIDLSEAGDAAHYLRVQLSQIPGAQGGSDHVSSSAPGHPVNNPNTPGSGNAIGGYMDKPGWVGEHGKEWFNPGGGGEIMNDRDIASAAMASQRGSFGYMGGGDVHIEAIYISGVGNDVSASAAQRFAEMTADSIADTLREQQARKA